MKEEPLVLCLTNTVAANFTANCLLAVGAKPAMIEDPSEAAELANLADAMLVNVGTVTAQQADVMRRAIAVCRAYRIPWVLDPVAVQTLAYRRDLVFEFLRKGPTLVRGNADEIHFLENTLQGFVGSVVTLATGAIDEVRRLGATHVEYVSGGVPILQSVTATGCAQGAICAVLLGRGLSADEAAFAASRLMKRAGERAFAQHETPGSFQAALIDALWLETHVEGCPS